jgi:hypothetical protein
MAEFYRLPVGSVVHVLYKDVALRDDLYESWPARLTTKEVFFPVEDVQRGAPLPHFFRNGNWVSVAFDGDNRANVARLAFPQSALYFVEM